jgi:predicted polyphosphate/ATP-dependent NAD kinase
MATVGIIANPASGKDIRRLVAHASVFDNNEKINIVRRVLLGLDAVQVERVLWMPDYFGIGERARHGLHVALTTEMLDMPTDWTQDDSTRAAALLREQGVQVIITLGGDGTNRAVAKGCGDVPLVAISTGTNNVFPTLVEGTLAGLAAGLIARGMVNAPEAIHATKRLEILDDGALADIALVDAVVYDGQYVGSRAIWQTEGIRQIVLTRADPNAIGLSAIGGYLNGDGLNAEEGLALQTGAGGMRVWAPIAPGMMRHVTIAAQQRVRVGESVAITQFPNVIALDGERTLVYHKPAPLQIRLSANGPRVVDIRATLHAAAAQGFFVERVT